MPVIHVGHEKEAVDAVGAKIMAILEARADQKTIRAALKAFGIAMPITNVSFSNLDIDCREDHSVHHATPAEPTAETDSADDFEVDGAARPA